MKLISLLLLGFSFLFGFSQVQEKDSLIRLINKTKSGNTKALLYAELSKKFKTNSIDTAVFYSKKGLETSKANNFKMGIAENSALLGDYYIIKNSLDSAKVNYVKSIEIYKETDSIYKYTLYKMRLGNINLAQNNYTEALSLYQDCLVISKEKKFNSLLPHLYNNSGLLFKQIEDYNDAISNFQIAYELFINNNDEANSVYPLYNIALIKSIIGKNDEAIDDYLNLIAYHLKTENWLSLAQIYNSISEIYLEKGDYNTSEEYVDMALKAIEDKKDSFNTGPTSFHNASIYSNAAELYRIQKKYEISKKYAWKALQLSLDNSYKLNVFRSSKTLADIYDKLNKIDSSLYYYKIYIDYNQQYKDEYDVKQLTKLKMQNEFDEILREKEIERIYEEATYKNRELKYIGLTIFTGLSFVIIILLYVNQKNKNSKLKLKEENLILEKNKLNQDLEYKKKELASNMMFLMEKNEFITSISKKLIELKPDAKKNNKELIQQIINEIKHNSSTKMWDEFELRFKEVHVKFYRELHKVHPDLTLNEIKICAFLRLKMSSKDISAITHQSVKSINMARFRLRKKLNIDGDENLLSYLNGL